MRMLADVDRADFPVVDTIRWVAASTVMLGHAVLFFLVPAPLSSHTLEGFATSLAGLRFPAVATFFSVSGFLVGGGIISRGQSFSFASYFIARFCRIYIVLIPALILTVILDGAAYLTSASNPVYGSSWPSGVMGISSPFSHYAFSNVLASVSSTESFLGEPLGSNTSLWSLGYEWVFYLLFPALLIPIRRVIRFDVAIAVTVVAIPLGFWVLGFNEAILYWTIWASGCAARAFALKRRGHAAIMVTAVLMLLLGLLQPVAVRVVDSRWSLLLIGVSVSLLLSQRTFLSLTAFSKLDQKFASMSYSLYVTHMPVLAFCAFALFQAGLLPSTGAVSPYWIVYVVSAAFACVSTAMVFEFLFERRTNNLRSALTQRAEGGFLSSILKTN